MVHEIEDFNGVYLLLCQNAKYKGRTYIGYTVDPNRRIKQHNAGSHAGGALRTSGRGPWEMVLIIHGFPNEISALRFEWAWQHPEKSRRLRHVSAKSKRESSFMFRWRVVCNMLQTAPWRQLCLTVRWLKQEAQEEFPQGLEPPLHMPIEFGPIKVQKTKTQEKKCDGIESSTLSDLTENDRNRRCDLCLLEIKLDNEQVFSCPTCTSRSHIICLARHCLKDLSRLLPIEGRCQKCQTAMSWGELVRRGTSKDKAKELQEKE